MLLSISTVVLFALVVSTHCQKLEIIDNDKICTRWLKLSSGISVDINLDPCSTPLAYDVNMVENDYSVRFCCVLKIASTTTVGTPLGACGKQAVTPIRSRIVGGQEAAPNSWPWLVSIQYRGNHFCGGTLIDEYHVLTAAHCFQDADMSVSDITLLAGLHRRSQSNDARVQKRKVARIFKHENYDEFTNQNDVAIVRLSTPITLNSYVNTACLPGKEPSINDAVIVAGWGATSFGGSIPDALRQATVSIMDSCRYVYQFNPSSQICAGHQQFSKDSCQGDSGGPLINEVNGQWTVSGIVSYGEECAKQDYPGVYTRVSYYLPWIRSKIAAS